MKNITETELEIVIEKVLFNAGEKRKNEAMGGGTTDGGAGRIEDSVKFYRLGKMNLFPDDWRPFLKDVRNELDPEFIEYKRLKEKFEE